MKTGTPAELAELLKQAVAPVALTGAGISVESGIPSFRGPHGLWTRYDPMEYAHIQAFLTNPAKVWKLLRELDDTITRARPNPAHVALARLEEMGRLRGIITQNVDNLHQEAGSRNVIEFHGNARQFVCLGCGRAFDPQTLDFTQVPLYCSCQGLIKPDIVFFGEEIPPAANRAAFELAEACDLMLVIGTSAAVMPANYLPYTAKKHGASIVEINLETTDLTRRLTDYYFDAPASQVLSETVALLTGKGIG
ncbi:MAG: NAD-dependent deacylase [Deltaproteobacteria bacterium]|nr:NAD-dependent deacylase [Deltaproteobacteria bacterium]